MARVGKLQAWFDWAKKHWVVTLWAGVVGLAVGYVAISSCVATVRTQLAPAPVPEVIQLEPVPKDSLVFVTNKTRWMVTLENRSDEAFAITRAHYRTAPLDDAMFNANAIELTGHIYRLPLNCSSGVGSRPLVPPFEVPSHGFATFIIDAGKQKDLRCLFRLSFETTQGRTAEMLAEPF